MKTVIEMAREANIEWDLIDEDEGQVWYITKAGLERFVELARAAAIAEEREACAKFIKPDEEHRRDASWGYIGGEEGVAMLDALAASLLAGEHHEH